LPTTTPI
jgi:23S rRNA U2552 (ribose-2'-O)-methylase RlmE/FtsJ